MNDNYMVYTVNVQNYIYPVDYKKAMIIFYEKNNISAFKKIFIDQFEFAVTTYF